ncbi:MAG TPA: sigma-70 family RNA polymerase sigma factor, partial [Armatimonadota bacterium]
MDERKLVAAAQRGDTKAFEQLVRAYQRVLVASARQIIRQSEDADDLVQEAFIDAYQGLRTLQEPAKFRAWLFVILRNKCYRYLQRQHPEELPLDDYIEQLAEPTPLTSDLPLAEWIEQLPLGDREVLAARYLQELSYREIAEVLGITEEAARTRCLRARARLRALARREQEEEQVMRRAMATWSAGIAIDLTGRVSNAIHLLPAPTPLAPVLPQTAGWTLRHALGHLTLWKTTASVVGILTIATVGLLTFTHQRRHQSAPVFNAAAMTPSFVPPPPAAVTPPVPVPALPPALPPPPVTATTASHSEEPVSQPTGETDTPASTLGTLSVTVSFEDGAPAGDVWVNLQRDNGQHYTAGKTNDNGVATLQATAGSEYTVQVDESKTTVTPVAGKTMPLQFTVQSNGVTIDVAYPDHRPADVELTAKSQSPKETFYHSGARIAPGRYRLLRTSPDITTLSAEATLRDGLFQARYTREWTFDQPAAQRRLEMVVPYGQRVAAMVVDQRGIPLVKAPILAVIEMGEEQKPTREWVNDLSTDERGHVDIGRLHAGQYRLILWTGERTGDIIPFEVTETQGAELARYVIGARDRRVVQQVFTVAGAPAARSELFASFAWGGRWVIQRAMSDARGRVIWDHLLPIPTIIWGRGITPGVLASDVTTVDAPLPPVTPGEQATVFVTVPDHGLLAKGICYNGNESVPTDPDLPASPNAYAELRFTYTIGRSFDCFATPRFSATHYALLDRVFPPIVSKDDTSKIYLSWQLPCAVRGRFIGADGQPIAGVSSLKIVPLSPDVWPAQMSERWAATLGLLPPPEQHPDGTFRLTVPFPGRYR